jgi:hypothetical protein
MGLPGIAHGLGRRHRLADGAETVNESALLVYADEHGMVNRVAYLRVEERHLLGRFDVAAEEDHAARLNFAEQLSHTAVYLSSGNTYEEHTPGFALNRQLLFAFDLFPALGHKPQLSLFIKKSTVEFPCRSSYELTALKYGLARRGETKRQSRAPA